MAGISFADQPQLDSFLRRLGEEYGQYAEALWKAGARRPEQLANARIEDLVAAGIPPLHASDIQTRSAPSAAAAAQGGAGGTDGSARGMTRDELYDKLKHLAAIRMIRPIKDRVVNFLIRFAFEKLRVADDALLAELYNAADATPMTSTKATLCTTYNVTLAGAGPYAPGYPSRSILLIGFVDSCKPRLFKFAYETEEVDSEYKIHEKMVTAGVPHIVSPIRKISYGAGSHIAIQEETGNRALTPKVAIEMPIYPATLVQMEVPVAEEVLLHLGEQLLKALNAMHKLGYVHNDIKAANVFLTSDGDAVLGDFGAACAIGAIAKQQTLNHWPSEVKDNQPSSPATDRFLLAATLLERAGAYKLGAEPQPSIPLLQAAMLKVKCPELRALVNNLILPKFPTSEELMC